jgi:hypothetical protein
MLLTELSLRLHKHYDLNTFYICMQYTEYNSVVTANAVTKVEES